MLKKSDRILLNLIDENRLLIISPFDKKITRPTSQTAIKRNQLIAEISEKIFILYSTQGGTIEALRIATTIKLSRVVINFPHSILPNSNTHHS